MGEWCEIIKIKVLIVNKKIKFNNEIKGIKLKINDDENDIKNFKN